MTSTRPETLRSERGALAIIVLAITAAHGSLLLMDGVSWDSWLIYTASLDGDWTRLLLSFTESGTPWRGYLHLLLAQTPDLVFAHRLFAFACILGSGLAIYAICRSSRMCNRAESVLIAVISQLYSAFRAAFELDLVEYLFALFLFLTAIWLALEAEAPEEPRRKTLRAAVVICFVASFTTRSLLVFYFGFLSLLFVHYVHRRDLSWQTAAKRFIASHLDYLLLPFAFWLVTAWLFPRFGLYSRVNELQFSAPVIAQGLIDFVRSGVGLVIAQAFQTLAGDPIVLLAVLVSAQVLYAVFAPALRAKSQAALPGFALLGFGLLWLPLAMVPYALVDKAPQPQAWTSRHALLLGVPMALILVGAARLLWVRPGSILPRLGLTVLLLATVGFGIWHISNYLDWQARWVKDRSVMLQLREKLPPPAISIFWIDDQFDMPGGEFYRYYEWSSLFKTVWGDESRIGFDLGHYRPKQVLKRKYPPRYNLRGYDRTGCQARLTISRASPISSGELTWQYLFYKFFKGDAALSAFLRSVTRIQIQSVPLQSGRPCAPLDLSL